MGIPVYSPGERLHRSQKARQRLSPEFDLSIGDIDAGVVSGCGVVFVGRADKLNASIASGRWSPEDDLCRRADANLHV